MATWLPKMEKSMITPQGRAILEANKPELERLYQDPKAWESAITPYLAE